VADALNLVLEQAWGLCVGVTHVNVEVHLTGMKQSMTQMGK